MIEQSLLNLGFRPLLEAALDATVVIDALGRVVALNHEVERLFGWPEPELLGQPMNRLIPTRFHRILDTLPGVVLVFHDMTEKRRVARKLSLEAAHDALTSLVNRKEFERRVTRALGDTAVTGVGEHALFYLADAEGEVTFPCFQQLM